LSCRVSGQAQSIQRGLHVCEAARDVSFFPRDGRVGRAQVFEGQAIDVQHREILKGRERSVQQRTRAGDANADHPDDHAGSPLASIACATAQRASSISLS
jgi:hypothetical protein